MKKLFIIICSALSMSLSAQFTDSHQFNYQSVNGISYSYYQDSLGMPYTMEEWYFKTSYRLIVDSARFDLCDTLLLPASVVRYLRPHTDTGSTSSGSVVFYLTVDGTNTGAALYPNGNIWPQFIINDSAKVFNYYWELSNSNRTLTVTVKYLDYDLLSGIYMTSAGTGRRVRITITGN